MPLISVRTPILTTLSEIWACAAALATTRQAVDARRRRVVLRMIFSSHRLLDFVLLQYCYPLRYRAPKPTSMCIPHDKISLIHIGAGAQRLRAALSRHRT